MQPTQPYQPLLDNSSIHNTLLHNTSQSDDSLEQSAPSQSQSQFYTSDPARFNESKLPHHARIGSCGRLYHGLINQATHNPNFYMTDDSVIPLLFGEPQAGDEEVIAGTQNVLDPTAGYWDNNPLDDATELRLNILAQNYHRGQLPIIATQESSEVHQQAFTKNHFEPIDSDNYYPHNIQTEQRPTAARQLERDQLNGRSILSRIVHDFTSSKRDWRGLVTYYDPTQYQVDSEHPPKFLMYSDANQKGWRILMHEIKRFLYEAGAWIMTGGRNNNAFSEQMEKTKNAVSGIARKDGLLVAHLIKRSNGRSVIVCNTHLESFNIEKRAGQRGELIEELKSLKASYPQSIILFMGDFNRPQLNLEAHNHLHDDMLGVFHRELDAFTMPINQITETFKGQSHLDGLYVIPPQGWQVDQTQGRTLKPFSLEGQNRENYLHYSDHSGVIVNARIRRMDHSQDEEKAPERLKEVVGIENNNQGEKMKRSMISFRSK